VKCGVFFAVGTWEKGGNEVKDMRKEGKITIGRANERNGYEYKRKKSR
jgi:hypothetical protein